MRRQFVFALILLFFSAGLLFWGAQVPSVYGTGAGQTIPTITPTSPPPTATQPGGGGGGGNNPTATQPASSEATTTPTSTLLPVNIAPTPVGGFLPTAVPCSGSPTIQTLGATNVRSGPGLEYDVIGQLVYLEVRYIVGRAETAEWWLIQFNNGQFGWVADSIVLVQGYTPIVPIVEAPPLDGSTPTPGPTWMPTPIPFCTVTPVPTTTPTATPIVSTAEEAIESPTATQTPTEPAPTEVRPTQTPIVQPTAVPLQPTPTSAATNASAAAPDESGGSSIVWIGLGVALLGGLALFLARRRG